MHVVQASVELQGHSTASAEVISIEEKSKPWVLQFTGSTQSVCVFVFYSCVVLLWTLQVPAAALGCLHDLQVAVHRRHHAAGQSTRHGRRWDCSLLLHCWLWPWWLISWLTGLTDWLCLTRSLLFVVLLHDPFVLLARSSVRFNCVCLSAGNPLLHVSNGVCVCVLVKIEKAKTPPVLQELFF